MPKIVLVRQKYNGSLSLPGRQQQSAEIANCAEPRGRIVQWHYSRVGLRRLLHNLPRAVAALVVARQQRPVAIRLRTNARQQFGQESLASKCGKDYEDAAVGHTWHYSCRGANCQSDVH